MAFIRPEGIISLCDSVPLNPSYDDTFTFKDKTAQYNYFNSKVKKRLQRYSVVRETTAALRVEGNAADYYGYNYMFFCNTNFTDKIFYAFITEAEYVNPNCTLLHFEIDVMQTFLNEYKILPSLVEREHVKDDSLNRNLKPENINVHDRVPFSQPTNMDFLIGNRIFVAGFTAPPSSGDLKDYWVIKYSPYDAYPNWDRKKYQFSTLLFKNIGNTGDVSMISYDKSQGQFTVPRRYEADSNRRSFSFVVSAFEIGTTNIIPPSSVKCFSENADPDVWYIEKA